MRWWAVAQPPPVHGAAHRRPELDSLRGLAAAVVVLSHFEGLWSREAEPPWLTLLLRSPLGVVVAGHDAVILFFILSGFVLTLPYLRPAPPGYFSFLTRRVLRIYVPYVAALVLAVACDAAFRRPLQGLAPWTRLTWAGPVDWTLALQHLAFLGSYDYWAFNGSFWSLIYEMRISVFFPVLCLLTGRLRIRGSLLLAALLSAASALLTRWLGEENLCLTLHYAALFVLGSLLARNSDAAAGWYARLDGLGRGALVLSTALLLVSGGRVNDAAPAASYTADWIVSAGVIGLMILSLQAHRMRRFLAMPVPKWLGRISYSTYLVHLTVLLSLVHGPGAPLPAPVLLAVYISLSYAAAALFYRLVEDPARKLGARLAAENRAPGQAG